MLRLPPQSSPLRSLFDVAALVAIGADIRSAPTFPQARNSARAMFVDGAVRAVTSICLRANGSLRLVQFGPKGGVRDLWTFTH